MSDRTRRRRTKPFVMLPIELLGHPAVLTLSHVTFRVLLLLAAQFNGKNNGAIGVTPAQAAEQGIGRNSLYRALHELRSRGLIDRTFPGSRVPPRPALHALTWIALSDTDHTRSSRVPSFDFRQWRAAV